MIVLGLDLVTGELDVIMNTLVHARYAESKLCISDKNSSSAIGDVFYLTYPESGFNSIIPHVEGSPLQVLQHTHHPWRTDFHGQDNPKIFLDYSNRPRLSDVDTKH